MDLIGTTNTANRFQHYELLRRGDGSPWELGRGTMGVTYKAFDVNLRCEVALKIVNPALLHHANARERFIREARPAARLRHRNTASVYHLGNDGDRFFYAMEFIDGETLDALVRRQGPLAPDAALRVLLQVARALAAAARQGVIHRDIKPGNLMVVHEDDDDHRVVKLIDFGLARANTSDDDAGNLTSNGFVGTPVYSSPEQMAEKPADGRSDIYSLGVTAWFLLVGKPPFNGTVASIFQQHATRSPPWETLPAAIPGPVRELLARMLEKNPGRRPQSAVELRQEIDACRERLGPAAASAIASVANPTRPDVQAATPVNRAPESGRPVLPAVLPRELGPGMILKGRYELLRLAGEGNSGQVFQVRDRASNDETRALKVFRAELTDATSKREVVVEEVRRIQAAPHANLIRLHAFERLGSRALDFLVEEWLRGFTILDLLAVRGGALPIAEALHILAQAAAAVDHASGRTLDRLDLALHQLHVHFPSLPHGASDEQTARGLMARPLAEWPVWTLKINPLGAIHGGLGSSTWASELTHLPGATPALDRDLRLDDQPANSAASYLRGLARTVYEILGGAPGMTEQAQDKRVRGVSLPALSEKANAILQRSMSEEAIPHASCHDFYAALAAATGNKLLPIGTEDSGRPTTASTASSPRVRSGVVDRSTRLPFLPPTRGAADDDLHDASVADLLNLSVPAAERDALVSQTSVWERLTLVSGGGRRNRSWLPTLLVAGVLGAAGGAMVFAAMKHHHPRATSSVARAADSTPARPPATSRAPTGGTPAMMKTSPAARAVSNDAPYVRDSPDPIPLAIAPTPSETTASTPPPLASTPVSRANVVKVRVETHPGGAEIRMGGKLLGTTPLELSLAAGDHQLIAHYRNWPEVHHTLHLDADQLSALDEIHMIPPTMVPTAAVAPTPGAKNHRPANATPSRASTPAGDMIVHFPSPSVSVPAPSRGLEPFLAQPTPVRRYRSPPVPFDPDGTSEAAPRRRPSDPPPLQSDDGAD